MNFFGLFDKQGSSTNIQSKQKIIKILVVVGIFALVGATVFFFESPKPKQQVGNFSIYNENTTLKSKWMSEAAGDMRQQKESMKGLEKKIQDVQDENKKLKEQMVKQQIPQPQTNDSHEPLNKEGLYKNFPKPKDSNINLDSFVPNSLRNVQNLVENKGEIKEDQKIGQMFNKTQVVENQVYQGSLSVENVSTKKVDDNATKHDKGNLDILPTGTIIRVVLVNGMDAPTMSQAKDNPLIVHMLVKDLAILPNKYKYDIRQCFIMGEGFGDLSSERVYIRANNLSCITEDGEHIDTEFKGYAAGEDGKIGLRGEVVSKQGAVLARAIVAGFVDGVAKGFNQVGQTVQITPYGTTQTSGDLSTTELAKKGMYGGLSSGASRLADFYLKLADQVFPIIEIEASREIDVVVTGKKDMNTLENTQPNKDKK